MKIPRTHTPQVTHDLYEKIPAMDLHDSQLLRWMITLVVDLHYPFSVGFPTKPEEKVEVHYMMDADPLSKWFQGLQDQIILPDVTVDQDDDDISEVGGSFWRVVCPINCSGQERSAPVV